MQETTGSQKGSGWLARKHQLLGFPPSPRPPRAGTADYKPNHKGYPQIEETPGLTKPGSRRIG